MVKNPVLHGFRQHLTEVLLKAFLDSFFFLFDWKRISKNQYLFKLSQIMPANGILQKTAHHFRVKLFNRLKPWSGFSLLDDDGIDTNPGKIFTNNLEDSIANLLSIFGGMKPIDNNSLLDQIILQTRQRLIRCKRSLFGETSDGKKLCA